MVMMVRMKRMLLVAALFLGMAHAAGGSASNLKKFNHACALVVAASLDSAEDPEMTIAVEKTLKDILIPQKRLVETGPQCKDSDLRLLAVLDTAYDPDTKHYLTIIELRAYINDFHGMKDVAIWEDGFVGAFRNMDDLHKDALPAFNTLGEALLEAWINP